MPHEKFKLYRFGKPLWKTSGRLKTQADIHPHPNTKAKNVLHLYLGRTRAGSGIEKADPARSRQDR